MKDKVMKKLFTVFDRKIKIERDNEEVKNHLKNSLPPHITIATFYNSKIRNHKILNIIVISTCLTIAIIQELRFNNRLNNVADQMSKREFLIIPGVPNYMSVKPGDMPINSVLGFSDWFVGQYMNFYYGDIEEKYDQLNSYMIPQFREQFKLFTKKDIKDAKSLSITQIYQVPPAKEAIRENDSSNITNYIVTYIGNTVRYTNDQQLPPTEPQVVILRFKTSRIDSTKMWLFEVVNMSVMRKSEYDSMKKLTVSDSK
jgi:hypothetical protein